MKQSYPATFSNLGIIDITSNLNLHCFSVSNYLIKGIKCFLEFSGPIT